VSDIDWLSGRESLDDKVAELTAEIERLRDEVASAQSTIASLRAELAEALSHEGQKDAEITDLLNYLHYSEETKSHPDWVAMAQQFEADRDRYRAALTNAAEDFEAHGLTLCAKSCRAALAGGVERPAVTSNSYTIPGPYAPIGSTPDQPT
jgi:chromosome segregation ATPase